MEFSRQEYWSGLPFPTQGIFPDPKVEATSLVSPPLAGRFFTTSASWKPSFSRPEDKLLLEYKTPLGEQLSRESSASQIF